MTNIPIKILREGAIFPTYATAQSAGADLYACLEVPVTLGPGETKMIPLGYSQPQTIHPGERIAQLVIVPCMAAAFTEADELDETERGAGGFGSTGTN